MGERASRRKQLKSYPSLVVGLVQQSTGALQLSEQESCRDRGQVSSGTIDNLADEVYSRIIEYIDWGSKDRDLTKAACSVG